MVIQGKASVHFHTNEGATVKDLSDSSCPRQTATRNHGFWSTTGGEEWVNLLAYMTYICET